MSSVVDEIAAIEKELLALTANQPPNPAQIVTFSVTHTTSAPNEVRTVVFENTPKIVSVYTISPTTSSARVVYEFGQMKIYAFETATQYVVISIGAFNLV